VKSRKTKTIYFDPPVRVSLFYWTFDVGEDDVPQFLADTYNRDRRVLRALNGPFKLRKAHRRAEE
jgi:murein L,D-transpeptidase YcbB/YkuD